MPKVYSILLRTEILLFIIWVKQQNYLDNVWLEIEYDFSETDNSERNVATLLWSLGIFTMHSFAKTMDNVKNTTFLHFTAPMSEIFKST
jgi:hypothetical protein